MALKTAVWKYPITIYDTFTLSMPKGAEVLHVDVQSGAPCLWARVDPNATPEPRVFCVAGTGRVRDDLGTHLGSVMLHGGALVFHVFDRLAS